MNQLHDVGMQAATESDRNDTQVGQSNVLESSQALFKRSDEVIDLMKESWRDDETLKNLSHSIKDSADKSGLIQRIKELMLKVMG